MTKEEAQKLAILRIKAGSHLFGLNVEGSDVDEMGVLIEPMHLCCGIRKPFEQYISEGEGGDCTIYSLRKYLSLALKGNPTVLTLLFAPFQMYFGSTSVGCQLQELAPEIVSKQAGPAFLGYLLAQRKRLKGERGNAGHGVFREELVAQYGYDTKFAMHMLRLGIQGVEFLSTGKLKLPMEEPYRSHLLGVRKGSQTLQACLEEAETLENTIKNLLDSGSPLPNKPNYLKVEEWMLERYWYAWSARRVPTIPCLPAYNGWDWGDD